MTIYQIDFFTDFYIAFLFFYCFPTNHVWICKFCLSVFEELEHLKITSFTQRIYILVEQQINISWKEKWKWQCVHNFVVSTYKNTRKCFLYNLRQGKWPNKAKCIRAQGKVYSEIQKVNFLTQICLEDSSTSLFWQFHFQFTGVCRLFLLLYYF